MRIWLLLDCPNLLHRAYYTTGMLAEGTIFGFLRYLLWLQNEFNSRSVVFAFDSPYNKRKKDYPEYKASRTATMVTMDEDKLVEFQTFRKECKKLRVEVLPALGYQNVFLQKGYEADDILASITQRSLQPEDRAILVSGDQDLYQLLSNQVTMWKPQQKEMFSETVLGKSYFGLSPSQWSYVKAISGCSSDGIAGIRGVGDLTAAKYLRGRLKATSTVVKKIEANTATWQRNLPLVRLPYEGTQTFTLQDDKLNVKTWNTVVRSLGMESLVRLR